MESPLAPPATTRAPDRARRLRVCMVSFYFPPSYSGSAIQARNLCRHLKRLDVDASVVSANLTASPPFEVLDGLPVYRIPVARGRAVEVPSFWLSLLWFLLRHRHDFDVIHAHGTIQHGAASLGGALIGCPTILKVAMADSDIAFHRQGRLMGYLNRLMVSRFDRYIALTDAIAREFAHQGLDVTRVRRIPNGVDTAMYAPVDAATRDRLRRELGLPQAPLVAYLGILSRRKNVDGVLRIWRSALAAGVPGHLVLVGPPPPDHDPFAAELRGFLADPLLAGHVSIVGFTQDVARHLQAADLFLFPSRQEGMPNVVLEAMACGLPVLVSQSAGVDHIVSHGENGFAFPIEDEAAFARAVVDLLTDAGLRAHLGTAARGTVQGRYSLEAIAERYVRLYQELVDA